MNRLRAFRDIEGINQDELAPLLNLAAQTVSAIESGRREFTGSLQVLGYSDARIALPDMSEPMHRHRASTSAAAKKRARELLRLAGEVFKALIGRTPNAPRPTLERLGPASSMEELEEVAQELRSLLNLELNGPIQNLTTAAERAGICIIPITGLSKIDGLSSWVDGVPVVGLAPTVPGDRFRFSLGHELAHLTYHRRRSETAEAEANRIAGALLFPEEDFDAAMSELPTMRDFINLKSQWGVAVSALIYRSHELGYIDDRRYRSLQIQMSKWRRSEPARFEPAFGSLLPRLVEVNGGVDAVAADLGVNRRHLRELVDWRPLRSA